MPDFALNAPLPVDTVTLLLVDGGFRLSYPRTEVPATIETEVAVTFRAPGLGFTVDVKRDILARQLPNGTARYVGLFTAMPTDAGAGGTEAVGGSYARVAVSAWTSATVGHVVSRSNTGIVQLPTLTADMSVRGWGVWDAETGGNLIAFGRLRNAGGFPLIITLAVNDSPRFLPGELVVGIQ